MALPAATRPLGGLLHIAQQDLGCGLTPVDAETLGIDQASVCEEVLLIVTRNACVAGRGFTKGPCRPAGARQPIEFTIIHELFVFRSPSNPTRRPSPNTRHGVVQETRVAVPEDLGGRGSLNKKIK